MKQYRSSKMWLGRALLFASCSLAPKVAVAEEPVSPARALFAEGRRLIATGHYAEACPKFEESMRLEAGVGVQFNLADCWEHIGRTASAHALFLGAAASAKAAGQTDREQVLRERLAALEPRLSRLVIESAEQDPHLIIKRGELPIDKDSVGRAVAVDPGAYEIVAKAPGKKPWSKTVKLDAGTKVVTVEVPKLEPAEEPAATPKNEKKQAAPAKMPKPAAAQTTTDRHRRWPNYQAIAVGGTGVVLLGVGTVFALQYKSANDDAKAICPESVGCTVKEIQDHDRLVEDARTSRRWTYAGFGLGFAALGGAAALYLLGPKESAQTGVVALPAVGQNGELGASLSGAF